MICTRARTFLSRHCVVCLNRKRVDLLILEAVYFCSFVRIHLTCVSANICWPLSLSHAPPSSSPTVEYRSRGRNKNPSYWEPTAIIRSFFWAWRGLDFIFAYFSHRQGFQAFLDSASLVHSTSFFQSFPNLKCRVTRPVIQSFYLWFGKVCFT